MKHLFFMRHGYLEGKYKDYSKLDFGDFEDLLLKKATPRIDKERTKIALRCKPFLSSIDFIICSTENRGIETAQIVNDLCGVDFEASPLLAEISFAKGVIEEKDVRDFSHLRKRILTQFFNSNKSEPFESAKLRFLQFLAHVKTIGYANILCITHGWFMRLIYIYSVKKSLDNISLRELLEAKIPDFLDVIEVTV